MSFHMLSDNKGFTLIELMMVVTILSVLAAIAIPYYKNYIERVEHAKTLQTMRMMERELIAFNLAYGHFPETLAEAGLGALRDPWGNPYRYLNIATTKGNGKKRKNFNFVPVNTDFDLYSMGPDGKSKTPFTAKLSRDDIVRADNGAFFGRVSQY